jgi:hypothetical protein
LISQSVGNKGITNAFEAEMMEMDFGEYLRNTIGDYPKGMNDPHAHHILFKKDMGLHNRHWFKKGKIY